MAQENYEIRNVAFRGNETLDEEFLLERMSLKEVSWLEKKLTDNEPVLYSQELIDRDLKRLVRIYQSEGFLETEVSLLPPNLNDEKKKMKLLIEVNEGEPIIVDSVSIRFKTEMENVDIDSLHNKLFRKLELTEGNRFRDESLNNDIELIKDALRSLGYAYVTTSYDLDLDVEEYTTGVYYSIVPGPKVHFGESAISGNNHVETDFIRKQLKYKAGNVYDKSALAKTRQHLYRLQLFRVVSVLPQKDESEKESPIPVEIYLEEAPRFSTRFGVGYGTEEKFRAFADLNYRGFISGARRLNLYLKHSALEPYHARLRWIQPQFLGLDGSISLNPFIMAKDEPGYEIQSYGISVPFTYLFTTSTTSKITYYFEDVEQTLEPGDEEFEDFEEDKFPYTKSGILLNTFFDSSTPTFSPEKGIVLSGAYKLNGHIFGGTFNYARLWGEFKAYHKIGQVVLAYRIMAGGITSADTSGFIPVEDRFYSGGSNSIRGWARSQLGPERDNGTPRGGKSIFETNFEVRHHFFWRLSVAAFIEAGNVWNSSYAYHFNDLGYAAGPGIRVETPVGPVRLDVGFPLWSEKKNPQFFISVGQAF
ncbi:MAG: BamA/OMP85 family outer membrane protein [Prolixibacteraceae bacterium]